ncbi:MAG TPA: substrate-binding domain-containing protein [Acidimicrobiia bacterium]|nr:substrate-binding domain-containing protein [Acidimicrobiia bacterium]
MTARHVLAGARAAVVLTAVLCAVLFVRGIPDAAAAPAKINGSGSTYVALAMQQWVADAQSSGLSVNYLPTGSPDGLTSYANSLTDFAGTEAEFSALSGGSGDIGLGRGYQYIPDVAGAIAVMYNVDDRAGNKVDYLHLSRRTIARIFTGDITNWSDPAISDDNKGLVLPDQPITVVYRAGQSGTTALFYDFVQNVAPDVFNPWAQRNRLPTNVRIIQLDSTPQFAPKTLALTGSDQIAQYVASDSGKWAIAYDEFGYAKVYGAPAAWVQNQSGAYVQPYAQNISAALESATLRPDLSQELSGVYSSTNPLAYPISAYSYIVTQCGQSPDRATCKGSYANTGITETFQQWLRYIACDGQVNMARIGYSPLPPNLSQEIANSIARLTGNSPEQLNAGNCANPRFAGNLGGDAVSPGDPLANVTSLSGDSGSSASSGGGSSAQAAAGGPAATDAAGGSAAAAAGDAAAGKSGAQAKSAGGGSTSYRALAPVAYNRPGVPGTSTLPLLAFLGVLAIPPLVIGIRRLRRPDSG